MGVGVKSQVSTTGTPEAGTYTGVAKLTRVTTNGDTRTETIIREFTLK